MPEAADLVALDVALRLPAPVEDAVTSVNARLDPPPAGFRFDATHLPHLTLAQQFSPRTELRAIAALVQRLVADRRPVSLTTGPLAPGGTSTVMTIPSTPELDGLHRDLMDQLAPFDVAAGDAAAFEAPGESVRDRDVAWVTRFRTEAAYDAYTPHITLGMGTLDRGIAPGPPIAFDADIVMVCVMGPWCTCRRVVASCRLGGRAHPAP